ncbi:hybrid sensor histidine kinase/response regulator LadS [Oceaniserpentilla sp. 4NH20-0058]|uniref:7TM diverse intracellular signaling domain-containing protein n=1 Tax=Oceaniserpentilla sp. 4NH20-0058 TaxID=3127660 RepID=UPI0031075AD2
MKQLVMIWVLMVALPAISQPIATQDAAQHGSVQSIWPGAYYLVDPDNAYRAIEILNEPPFHLQTSQGPPNLGFVAGQVWVWSRLHEHIPSSLQLQIGFPHIKSASVYVYSETGELLDYSEDFVSQPFSDLLQPSQFPNTRLNNLQPNATIILKLSSDHALRLPINIGSPKAFAQNNIARMAIIFVSLGVLLALFVYNLILFISTKRLYYLFYCLNLGLLQIFFVADLGFFRYFYAVDHWLNLPQTWGISVCLAFIFAILFAQSFLRLPKYHPKWNKWFYTLILSVFANIILILLVSQELAIGFYLVISALYQVSVLIVSIIALRGGFRPARFFLLAWGFLAAGGFIYQLTILGSIPVNLFTEHAFLIGTVIEALLLSWALAELIGKLQYEQLKNERHYQSILQKTSKRLSNALSASEKHKKVRDVFLKHISHELKTPLHSIQHILELSLQGYSASSELLHDASHSTRLISRHIDKLLLNTELSASEPEFESERVDINSSLKNWNDDFYFECHARNTEFSLVTNLYDWDELEGTVRPIYLMLTELIYKLADLEIESILLSISYQENRAQLHVSLDMHCTGQFVCVDGMSIFQNENDLAFFEQILALLGGQWNINSDAPILQVELMIPNIIVHAKQLADQLPKRVLVIEDNEINQKVMASMLTRMGIEFEIAINGQEGLIKQAENPAPIILMDCQMPVLDGFDTTIAMRQDVQRYLDPIIIAVSANSMEMDKTRCISVGMNDFIAKPVRMEDLRSSLLRWESAK